MGSIRFAQQKKGVPRSYDVMDTVIRRKDAAEIGRRIRRSVATIRNWCRPVESQEGDGSGRYNPLDVLRTIISFTNEEDGSPRRAEPLADYVAQLCDGTFIRNPDELSGNDSEFLSQIGQVMQRSSNIIEKSRLAYLEETPGVITGKESTAINQEINETIKLLVAYKRWVLLKEEESGQQSLCRPCTKVCENAGSDITVIACNK